MWQWARIIGRVSRGDGLGTAVGSIMSGVSRVMVWVRQWASMVGGVSRVRVKA